MPTFHDGPASGLFRPLPIKGNVRFDQVQPPRVSDAMAEATADAPTGACVCWGVPFQIGRPVLLHDRPVEIALPPTSAPWLIFMHTTDVLPQEADKLVPYSRRQCRTGSPVARYVFLYADGTTHAHTLRHRFEINCFRRDWGPHSFESVAHRKPHATTFGVGQWNPVSNWAWSQYRCSTDDCGPWIDWLWAWENPHPKKKLVGLRLEPLGRAVLLSAVSAGTADSTPLRWRRRRKALLTLRKFGEKDLWPDDNGQFAPVRIDLGQVIALTPQAQYPDDRWPRTLNNALPEVSKRTVLVEYTSHEEAVFHLANGGRVAVAKVEDSPINKPARGKTLIVPVAPADQLVTVRAVDKATGREVPVKLHLHGQAGEYLAPETNARYPDTCFMQDLQADFSHQAVHHCAYVDGRTQVRLPLGRVYVEASRGFEVAPVRKVVRVTPGTREIVVELEKVLPWRERNWVSADTHVHFLSPQTLLLEGRAEGVNVVNLLATRWGEMVTSLGDFDGATTLGSREAGGDGEYLVRVGTENRQHVLGHISLLGYKGRCILPLTTGGADESALGDAVDCLMTDWARACRKQGGLVVASHFPNPPAEHAATLVQGDIDAVEMTSWGNLYAGIDPYSLTDWYRFLNCGYMTAAVGGTDKMANTTPVGAIRTYAKLPPSRELTYDRWMQAVRGGNTFVTYGPLMEFAVEGLPGGSKVKMSGTGGTVDVTWTLASACLPMTRVELVVNGEIVRSQSVAPGQASGHWPVKVDRTCWMALLVRGQYPDQPEMIAAHSSPVRVDVRRCELLSAPEATTILEQIEGSLAYLDNVGTRSQTQNYRRMRLSLTQAYRGLHNRLHQAGLYHDHADK